MNGWMIWLLVLLALIALAMVKIGVHVLYEAKKMRLELLISGFKLVVVGDEKKKKAKKAKKEKKEPKTKNQQTEKKTVMKTQSDPVPKAPQKKKGKLKPWIDAALEYWREILGLIGRVLTTPTLDILRLELWVGGGDAEACAMQYGKICAIVGAVLPVVENTFGIRKRKIDVYCCFDRDDLEISAEASIIVRVYEIFALVFALLGLGLKLLLKAKNNKKAVQQYESSSS